MKPSPFVASAVSLSLLVIIGISDFAKAGVLTGDGKGVPTVKIEEKAESPYEFNFSLGYDSEYIFRGVDILKLSTDSGDLVWADFNISAYGFTVGAWYAEAINRGTKSLDYNELDLYLSYNYAAGPVNLTAGYVYYLFPEFGNSYSHELSLGISTEAIPFITPSLTYYYDLSDDTKRGDAFDSGVDLYDGGYLEFKVAASIPIFGDTLSVEPYALVAYDFEYNSAPETNQWNNIQVGVTIPYKITPQITVSAYGAYSWALSAIDNYQNDELWGGGKIGFSF